MGEVFNTHRYESMLIGLSMAELRKVEALVHQRMDLETERLAKSYKKGDFVKFFAHNKDRFGTIVSVHRKTVKVKTDTASGGQIWRVSPQLITRM